jgi:hypothetical protein
MPSGTDIQVAGRAALVASHQCVQANDPMRTGVSVIVLVINTIILTSLEVLATASNGTRLPIIARWYRQQHANYQEQSSLKRLTLCKSRSLFRKC